MENKKQTYPLTFLKQNSIKNYQWGSTNPQCYVAQLSKSKPEPTAAQLWMGIHPKGQSKIQNNIILSKYLQMRGIEKIQFLFKVLSIRKCLSLQVHPNKQQAIFLNQKYNSIYVDNNDKPEMFYTLTQFQCFLGFVNLQKIKEILQVTPFTQWVQKDQINSIDIITVIQRILRTDKNNIQNIIKQAAKILPNIYPSRIDLFNRLSQQFPNDIGIIVTFLLNYYQIQPNKCFYIPCKTPHAYIKGQCLQIMKNSDNVIRMGLTPKLKDLNVLSYVLSNSLNPINQIQPLNGVYTKNNLYFRIINNQAQFQVNFPQICIVIEGNFTLFYIQDEIEKNKDLQKGNIFMLQIGLFYKIKGKGLMCIGWSTFKQNK